MIDKITYISYFEIVFQFLWFNSNNGTNIGHTNSPEQEVRRDKNTYNNLTIKTKTKQAVARIHFWELMEKHS